MKVIKKESIHEPLYHIDKFYIIYFPQGKKRFIPTLLGFKQYVWFKIENDQSISFAFLLLPTASPHFTPFPQHQPFFVLFCLCNSKLLTKDFLSWATLAKLAAVWVWLMGGTGRRNRPEFLPDPLWFDKASLSAASSLLDYSAYQFQLSAGSPPRGPLAGGYCQSLDGHHPLLIPLNLHT